MVTATWFIGGMFAGAFLGFIAACILIIARESDENGSLEHYYHRR